MRQETSRPIWLYIKFYVPQLLLVPMPVFFLLDKLRAGIVASVKVDDAALLESYDEAKTDAITLPFAQGDKQQADKIVARLRKGEDFAHIAKAESKGARMSSAEQWQRRMVMKII